jgi:hypothetical protein
MLLKETVLQRMQLAILFEAFDRGDRTSVGLNGESRARLDRITVHHDRARAAVTRVATDVRARQAQRFAEEVDQQQTWFDVETMFDAVDSNFDWNFRHR